MAEGDRIDADWLARHLTESPPPFAEPGEEGDAAKVLVEELGKWAEGFALRRWGAPTESPLQLGPRGVHDEEAFTFLRAVRKNHVNVDDAGFVRVLSAKPKPNGGVYSLFSGNTYDGVPYVSLNTEYLIQFGAASELVHFWGWKPPTSRWRPVSSTPSVNSPDAPPC